MKPFPIPQPVPTDLSDRSTGVTNDHNVKTRQFRLAGYLQKKTKGWGRREQRVFGAICIAVGLTASTLVSYRACTVYIPLPNRSLSIPTTLSPATISLHSRSTSWTHVIELRRRLDSLQRMDTVSLPSSFHSIARPVH